MSKEEKKLVPGRYHHLPLWDKVMRTLFYVLAVPVLSIPIYAITLLILLLAVLLMVVATPFAAPYIALVEIWTAPESKPPAGSPAEDA